MADGTGAAGVLMPNFCEGMMGYPVDDDEQSCIEKIPALRESVYCGIPAESDCIVIPALVKINVVCCVVVLRVTRPGTSCEMCPETF